MRILKVIACPTCSSIPTNLLHFSEESDPKEASSLME